MTEETIKNKISDWYTVDSPKGLVKLSKQLLEQHEAEMELFGEWVIENDVFLRPIGWEYDGEIFIFKDLLELFKTRKNK